MKLVLPSNKKFVAFIKLSILFALPALLFVWFLISQDPLVAKSESFISSNKNVLGSVGNITGTKLVKATYVDDAIDYEGKFTPGYNLYRYKVIGTQGTFSATVKVDMPKDEIKAVYSLKSIDKY